MIAAYAIIEYFVGKRDGFGKESDSENPVANEEQRTEQG
jgi:hypothetical protein